MTQINTASVATLIRIVRMTFHTNTVKEFEDLYAKHSADIISQPGCLGVDLVNELGDPNVRATISRWVDEKSLNSYRKSELFGVVWPATKTLFKEKPEVWSYKVPAK